MLDATPKNWGDSITLIANIHQNNLITPILIINNLTKPTFINYVERCVVPELRAGDVVVLDNLGAHRMADVQRAIEAAGAWVLFLPPYSPDLNPIELAWSKVKALCESSSRARSTLRVARVPRGLLVGWSTARALESITATDLTNWLRHAGYGT